MYSKQRGRVIEYREILYGYNRVSPQHGADYILDLLLVYKKYRGHKMTIPVRRHIYLQQQFTGKVTSSMSKHPNYHCTISCIV
jgi:chondroitin sulfate synthase